MQVLNSGERGVILAATRQVILADERDSLLFFLIALSVNYAAFYIEVKKLAENVLQAPLTRDAQNR
jgi:hypothetical protein